MNILHPLPCPAPAAAPFTYPFCYEPTAEVRAAAAALRRMVEARDDWARAAAEGKMMGVLIVEGGQFLAAFSGTLCGKRRQEGFVPPVADTVGYFQEEEARIGQMEGDTRARSVALQDWFFRQFSFLNARGERRSLVDIFAPHRPPSGAGECCAPKLLQAAYELGIRPLAMGEFWMGAAPKDEVRRDGMFYPACRSRCKPILDFMLGGLDVAPNPLLARNMAMASMLRTVYDDEWLRVVDKPSGMLSVPGKDDMPSVASVTGLTIVHRLDMDTSGLMVVAKTPDAARALQDQFVRHIIYKEYTALLEHPMAPASGTIDLRICPNPYDRPRQIVSDEYGRRSITHYEVSGRRALFRPDTGRTHQLRLHAAHPLGLDNPIQGDRLYGHAGARLCLHASRLDFTHPHSGERLSFTSAADFV